MLLRPTAALLALAAPRLAPPLALSASRFGTKDYWNAQYAGDESASTEQSEENGSSADDKDFIPSERFSWYTGWEELAPFWAELVPDKEAQVLLPGVGNDDAMVALYDAGWTRLCAFDYAPEAVERSRALFGERADSIELRVADARELPFNDGAYDAVLEKGALDSVFLSGEGEADQRLQLQRAVDELARTVRVGGVVVSVTGFCDKIGRAFRDPSVWRCVRDGGFYITEDGDATNSINAYFMAWVRVGEEE